MTVWTGFTMGANAKQAQLLPPGKRERKRASVDVLQVIGFFRVELRLLPSGGALMDTPLLLSTKPVKRSGHSYVVSLSKEVRSALNVKQGEQLAFRKVGRYVFIAVVRAFAVAPVSKEEFRQAREALGV